MLSRVTHCARQFNDLHKRCGGRISGHMLVTLSASAATSAAEPVAWAIGAAHSEARICVVATVAASATDISGLKHATIGAEREENRSRVGAKDIVFT